MKRARCLFSASSALRRVFVPKPAASHVAPTSQLQHFLLPAVYRAQPPVRLFSGTAHVFRFPNRFKNKTKSTSKSRFPRDREIVHKLILVRGEDGRLSEPQHTSEVLARLDLRVNSLVMLAMPESDKEGGGASEEDGAKSRKPAYPICRIVDKKVEQAAELEKAATERKKSVGFKELEVNWAIAPHDLQTKLRQLKSFLAKGMRVEILLLSRVRQKKRQAGKDEAEEVLQAVKEAVEEVPGSKEFKPMEGTVGKQARLFIEGPQGGAS